MTPHPRPGWPDWEGMHLQIKQVVVERGVQAVRLLKERYTLCYDTCSSEHSPTFLTFQVTLQLRRDYYLYTPFRCTAKLLLYTAKLYLSELDSSSGWLSEAGQTSKR